MNDSSKKLLEVYGRILAVGAGAYFIAKGIEEGKDENYLKISAGAMLIGMAIICPSPAYDYRQWKI